jgi:hypothetical protein
VSWPKPHPGLVIRYAYLWRCEGAEGQRDGQTNRPCAVILAVQARDDGTRVYALPITDTPPAGRQNTVEVPAAVKVRLGLEAERSWMVLDEVNDFIWPGADLRFRSGKGPESAAYGFLPPTLFRVIRDRFLAPVRAQQAARVARTDWQAQAPRTRDRSAQPGCSGKGNGAGGQTPAARTEAQGRLLKTDAPDP